MKQVLQNMGDGKTYLAEVPVPSPQAGMALVRTAASLVSAGTERMLVEFAGKSLFGKARARPDLARQAWDKARREGAISALEAALNRLDQPMALGYSSAGTIVALGKHLEGFQVGQRVACAGGGYAVHAEYALVPRRLMAALPDGVDFESAAFTTLGAIALHGFRLAEAQVGARLAVIGLGLLGLLAGGIARAAGCAVLGIDLDPWRVQLGQNLGIEAVERPLALEAAQAFSRGRGCDAVLICADTPTSDPVELAAAISRDRGRVVALGAVGLELPRKAYYEKELTLVNSRSYGPGRYDPAYEDLGHDYPIGYVRWTEGRNLEAFVDLLADGRLDVRQLITHRFSIEQAMEAYRLITRRSDQDYLGVVLTYPASNQAVEVEHTRPAQISPSTGTSFANIRPDKVRLGVLGAGNFATQTLLPALKGLPGLDMVGICSASGLSAAHTRKRFGFRVAVSDEMALIDDPAINTIAILTRHSLHASQVIASLSVGKHVFCEKPLALDLIQLGEIEATIEKLSNLESGNSPLIPNPYPLLMVGFNRRFAPLALRLKDFIARRQEPLVANYRVNAGYLPPDHWTHDPEQGGGRLLGEGCHFVDFLTFLVGEPPVSVFTRALPDLGRYRADNAVLTFEFPDGSLGVLTYLANGDRSFSKERIEVFAAGRVAVLEDFHTLEMVQDGRSQTGQTGLRQDKGYRGEWQAFIHAIRSGGPPPIPYAHLFGVSRATFAVLESLHTGEKTLVNP